MSWLVGKLVHDDADDKGYTWIYYTNLYQDLGRKCVRVLKKSSSNHFSSFLGSSESSVSGSQKG